VFYLVGAGIASGVFLLVNFLLNRRWAFRARHGRVWTQLFRQAVVVAGGSAIAIPLLWLFVGHIHLPYQVGWPAAGVVCFFSWTFPMNRFFTYPAAPAVQYTGNS
jgi:putative flippase GtrA